MRDLRFQLPPLNSLVAFEAAARHLSFTKAGQELRVSREAVSRQIRLLEDHLGAKLFLRLYRALELTREGEEFYLSVRQSLRGVARAAEGIRGAKATKRIAITATVAIASYWLTPRLPRFRDGNPQVELRVNVSDEPLRSMKQTYDVGLRYGDRPEQWPGVAARKLFEVDSFPLCTPAYLAARAPITCPADFLDHTLLNLDGAPHSGEDWSWWLEQAGLPPSPRLRLLGFDNYSNVIQAALDSQGIAIGFGGIVDALLRDGALLRPLDLAFSKGGAVYLTLPQGERSRPEVAAFVDWVTREAAGMAGPEKNPSRGDGS